MCTLYRPNLDGLPPTLSASVPHPKPTCLVTLRGLQLRQETPPPHLLPPLGGTNTFPARGPPPSGHLGGKSFLNIYLKDLERE